MRLYHRFGMHASNFPRRMPLATGDRDVIVASLHGPSSVKPASMAMTTSIVPRRAAKFLANTRVPSLLIVLEILTIAYSSSTLVL